MERGGKQSKQRWSSIPGVKEVSVHTGQDELGWFIDVLRAGTTGTE